MAMQVRMARVVSIDDNTDGDRIKVKLRPEDESVNTVDGLPYAFPLLPKTFHMKPKVGEAVFIFLADGTDGNSQRYYIGPIISQPHHMEEEPMSIDAVKYFKGRVSPDPAPSMDASTHGAFMEDDNVGLYGRKNTELVLTDTDAQLRAGVRLSDETDKRKITFNSNSPTYVKLKRYNSEQVTDKGQTYDGTATIVSDKINLISNKSKDYFKTGDKDELISDDEMKKLIDKAHQLPYGDVLVEFMELFRTAFLTHVHPFSRMAPCVDASVAKVQGYDLDKILSKDVRIN